MAFHSSDALIDALMVRDMAAGTGQTVTIDPPATDD